MTTLAFIGAGNMAEAICRGLLAADWPPTDIRASDPRPECRKQWANDYRVQMFERNGEAADGADVVVLCVKPQIIAKVLPDVRDGSAGRLTISVAAGTPIAKLADGLEADARIIRVMPNQAALVAAGATGLVPGGNCTPRDTELATQIFTAVGHVEVLKDEAWLDAVTALSGSGPAFVYRFAAAMAAGGVAGGLTPAVARRLAAQTIFGAGKILLEEPEPPEVLIDRVASPGGTTVAGLGVLDTKLVDDAIQAAVEAATQRAKELSEGS